MCTCCAVFKIDYLPPPVYCVFERDFWHRFPSGKLNEFRGIIKTSAEERGTYSKTCNFQIFYQPRTQATFVPKSTLGISTHRAKHVNIIKLNALVNNKWQKSGKSTVAHAIMALFKIFDSAHGNQNFSEQ